MNGPRYGMSPVKKTMFFKLAFVCLCVFKLCTNSIEGSQDVEYKSMVAIKCQIKMCNLFSWKMNLRIFSLLVTRTVGSGQNWCRLLGAAGMCSAIRSRGAELECCVVEEDWQSGQSYTAQWQSFGFVPQHQHRSGMNLFPSSLTSRTHFLEDIWTFPCPFCSETLTNCLSGPRWWRLSTRQSTARPGGSSSAFCQGPSVRITHFLTHTQVQDPKHPSATSHLRVQSCSKKHFIFTRKCAAWPWVQRTVRPTAGRRWWR